MQSDIPEQSTKHPQKGESRHPGGIMPSPGDGVCLDSMQLDQLEQSFRQWAEDSQRRDVRFSRRRILLVFLLIRYTGAKLSEVLRLDPFTDIQQQMVCIRDVGHGEKECIRKISIAENLDNELRETLADPEFHQSLTNLFAVDPAFVRRKFYERAEACGFVKRLGGPEMIRRARAVELMQANMPLPAVQRILGHSTPNLTAAHVTYSEEELHRVTRFFVQRESIRKTSARNTFYGKISEIRRGDIQAQVSLVNPAGHRITTLITIESLERLQLQVGGLVTAEVKAPLVLLQPGDGEAACSADNQFQGQVVRINKGKVSWEYVVRIDDDTELCALASASSGAVLQLAVGDEARVVFSCFAVVLHD